MTYLYALFLGYILGSIPFGLVFTRLAGLGDIRQIGSGNIGATNVLRTGRKDLALLTLIFDIGKAGFAAVIAEILWGIDAGLVAGFFGVIGHNFPVWLKFKGGKGVASTLGMMLATYPWVGVLACISWLVTAFLFRYSSLSALVALALSPFYALVLGVIQGKAVLPYVVCYGMLAVLSFVRHRANIKRLLDKSETKIKLRRSK